MGWLTVERCILIISSANTLGIVVLVVAYFLQVRFLKKKLIGLSMRRNSISLFRNRSQNDMLQDSQEPRSRRRANSCTVREKPPPHTPSPSTSLASDVNDQSDTSTSSSQQYNFNIKARPYPLPAVPKQVIKQSLEHLNQLNQLNASLNNDV